MNEVTFVGYTERTIPIEELLNMVEDRHKKILQRAIISLFDRGWDGKLSDLKYKYGRLRLYTLGYKEEWEEVVEWLEADALEIDRYWKQTEESTI